MPKTKDNPADKFELTTLAEDIGHAMTLMQEARRHGVLAVAWSIHAGFEWRRIREAHGIVPGGDRRASAGRLTWEKVLLEMEMAGHDCPSERTVRRYIALAEAAEDRLSKRDAKLLATGKVDEIADLPNKLDNPDSLNELMREWGILTTPRKLVGGGPGLPGAGEDDDPEGDDWSQMVMPFFWDLNGVVARRDWPDLLEKAPLHRPEDDERTMGLYEFKSWCEARLQEVEAAIKIKEATA